MGSDHPVVLVQGLQGRPLVLHRRSATHRGELRRADLRKHLDGRDRVGRGQSRPGLQRLRRDRAGELPADQDRGAAEPQRADRLRPAPGRADDPDRPPRRRAPARPGRPARRPIVLAARSRSTPTARTACTAPAIDNNFATNHWVYLYYAPPTVTTSSCPTARSVTQTTPTRPAPTRGRRRRPRGIRTSATSSSRGSSSSTTPGNPAHLDLSTEQQILRVTNNRGACCHVAGDIDFDKHNNLWLVTGDDTPAGGGDAGGFAPSNDQKTDENRRSASTNATGGTFTLTFNGQTTAPLAFNATAAQIARGARGALATSAPATSRPRGGPVNTANVTCHFRGHAAGDRTSRQLTADAPA